MSSINTNNINIDDNGRVTISGSSSGINSREIIDATITARRIPAVQLETRISENTETINAYGELDTLNQALVSALESLRGSTSFFADNTFDSKIATGVTTAAASAGTGYTPSATESLISASVSSSAETGRNTVQINTLAQANQIRTDAFTSRTDTLDSLGITLGDFSVNGTNITVDSDDTLNELRAKINAADAGVTASVVSANDTEHYLVLTAEDTGAANAIRIDGAFNTQASVTNTLTTTLSLNNSSFEQNTVPDGSSQPTIAEWISTNASVSNPTTTDYPSGVPNGTEVATLTSGGTMSQTMSDVVEAGADYRIGLSAGRRTGDSQGQYEIHLYAGGTLIGNQLLTNPSADGAFNQGLLEVSAAELAGHVGEQLRVEVVHISGGDVDIDTIQIQRDTFQTVTQSVPNSVTPSNASFEAELSLVPNDGNNKIVVEGWSSTGGNLATVNAAPSDFASEASDGDLIMTMTTGKTAFQDLSATFNSNQDYQLTVDLGNRTPVGGTSDYAVRLYAGATLVGETTGTSTLGSLNQVTLDVDGSAFSAANGEILRIEFANTSGAELAFDNVNLTTSSTASALGFVSTDGGIKNELTVAQDANLTVNGITDVTRDSNEIDDIIDGVTLSLFQAEADTVITLDIAADLNTVKTDLVEFANAYNDLRTFIDDQRAETDRDGDGEDEFGVLAFDSNLRQIASQLSQIVATEVAGNTDGFQSLGQIGLELNEEFLLEVNDEVLDNKLLTGVEDIQKLFEIDVASTDSRIQLVDRTGATSTGTYTLNIGGIDASGNITSANINGNPDGSDDGSVTISGKTITATDSTAANGLKILFNGEDSSGAVAGISVTVNRGIADLFYDNLNDYSRLSGTFNTEIANLTEQSTNYESRIDTIDARLEITRQTLERQYIAMETALAQLESLREQINSFFNQDSDS